MIHYHNNIKKIFILIMALIYILLGMCFPVISFDRTAGIVHAEETSSNDSELSRGSTGDNVVWLQESLNELLDAGLTVDGSFGEATENAVIELQNGHGLHPDGVADKVTITMIKELLKKKRPSETTTAITIDTSSDNTSENLNELFDQTKRFPEPSPYDIRNIPAKKKGHLFSGYWSEYFITLKDVVLHPKAMLAPVKQNGSILLVLCGVIVLWGIFFSLPIVSVIFVHPDGREEEGCLPIISKNFYKLTLMVLGVIFLLMPFFSDTDYIRTYSYAGWISTILIAVLFLIIRIILGFIAGGLILYAIFSLLHKISDDLAIIVGLIPGVAVFMIFYFLPWLMQMWRLYML